MFTGLIQALGILIGTADNAGGKKLSVSLAELVDAPIRPGDSVCVSGVCLTATGIQNGNVSFNVVAETLRRTTLGDKLPGDRVNLELSLQPQSFIGGHFVQGHVDATATVTAVQNRVEDWRVTFELPPEYMKYVVPKGSITVDGVSMTVAEVSGHTFTLAVIPTTLENTTLSGLVAGDRVNVETDILSRTVVHYLENAFKPGGSNGQGNGSAGERPHTDPAVTLAKLVENGFA